MEAANSPELCVQGRGLQPTCAKGFGTADMEYVTGLNLDLSWEGNADAYGGTVDVYRWGWDIPDLEESVGWSPWSTETVLESPAPTDQIGRAHV